MKADTIIGLPSDRLPRSGQLTFASRPPRRSPQRVEVDLINATPAPCGPELPPPAHLHVLRTPRRTIAAALRLDPATGRLVA